MYIDDKNDGEIEDDDNDDDDDSDDDVNVVIGDIKTTPATYSTLNIKRTGLLTSASGIDKLKVYSMPFHLTSIAAQFAFV